MLRFRLGLWPMTLTLYRITILPSPKDSSEVSTSAGYDKPKGQMLAVLEDSRKEGGYSAHVVIELLAKSFDEKLFFAADAQLVANEEQRDAGQQRLPAAYRQARGKKQSEHPQINWISYDSVRPLCDQLVPVHHACNQGPLLTQGSDCCEAKPNGTYRGKNGRQRKDRFGLLGHWE